MLNGRGWWRPPQAARWHYIGADNRALCGKWMEMSRNKLAPETSEAPDDCKACRRKVDAMKAKESTDV